MKHAIIANCRNGADLCKLANTAPLVKFALDIVRSKGLHMDTTAARGVAAPSSPRYLQKGKQGTNDYTGCKLYHCAQ